MLANSGSIRRAEKVKDTRGMSRRLAFAPHTFSVAIDTLHLNSPLTSLYWPVVLPPSYRTKLDSMLRIFTLTVTRNDKISFR